MLLMVRRLNNIISHFCIRLAFQDLDPGSYSLEGRLPERWSRGHTKGCLLGAIFFTVFEMQKLTILFDALFLFLFRLQPIGKALILGGGANLLFSSSLSFYELRSFDCKIHKGKAKILT